VCFCLRRRWRRASPVADGAGVVDGIRRFRGSTGESFAASPETGVISRIPMEIIRLTAPLRRAHKYPAAGGE